MSGKTEYILALPYKVLCPGPEYCNMQKEECVRGDWWGGLGGGGGVICYGKGKNTCQMEGARRYIQMW